MMIPCRYGTFSIPDKKDLIFDALREYGEWAQQEIDVLARFIRLGSKIVDAGAFVGTHARAFSQMVGGEGKVYAFEPNPVSYQYLNENARLSSISNIATYPIALGEHSSDVKLTIVNEGNVGACKIDSNVSTDFGITAHVQRLDDFELNRVDFIKADIEGTEFHMLLGAEKTIAYYLPDIFLEVNNLQSTYPILDWASARDYIVLGLNSAAFNPNNFNGKPENIFGQASECGILLIHSSNWDDRQSCLLSLNLPRIETADSLALLLLHKPQYFHEVLEGTSVTKLYGSYFDSPKAQMLVTQLSERDKQIAIDSELLSEQETQMQLLATQLSERDKQIAIDSELLSEQETQMQLLATQLSERDKQIAIDSELLSEQETQMQLLATQLSEREAHLNRFLASRSWRLTKPLRIAARLLRDGFKVSFNQDWLGDKKGDRGPEEVSQISASQSLPVDIIEAIKADFDCAFYLAKYPDIEKAGVDPISHYCLAGWRERRDPSSWFSTAYYLDENSDVADAEINPFWHYIVAGKNEGRATRHPGGFKADMLKSLPTTFDKIALQWKTKKLPQELLSPEQVVRHLMQRKSDTIRHLAISIGHDHYRKISGGIQVCIQREEYISREYGVLYLNAHPWQPLPRLANSTDELDPLLCLILEGREIGVCYSSTLTQAVEQISGLYKDNISVIIHSLLGHSIEHVQKLIEVNRDRKCWFWLHDFFSLCPSYTLQRNTVSFCGAPEICSNACSICIYSDERRSHLRRMQSLFEDASVIPISPSEVTAQFWCSKTNITVDQVVIQPHLDMRWANREFPVSVDLDTPISIGFIGAPVHHKGWPIFENLVKIFRNDLRFQFFYFGNHKVFLSGVECNDVHVSVEDYFVMTRAVEAQNTDFVLHWATWPETFSLTTHEAMAAGAYILTNSISGNVAAVVSKTGMGRIFENEQELIAFFKDGSAELLMKSVRHNRATRYCQMNFSDMTLPLFISTEAI